MTDTSEHAETAGDRIAQVERENEQLRQRLDALEAAMTGDAADPPGDDDEPADADATPELLTSGGQPTKVVGNIGDTDAIGVLGNATGSGATRGVLGTVDSSDTGAAGVEGTATASSGTTYGVKAVTSSTEADAAALRAEDTGSFGITYGVEATTESISPDAAAVRAATVEGDATAVVADTRGAGGNAIRAYADSDTYSLYAIHEGTESNSAPAISAENATTDDAVVLIRANGSSDSAGTGLGSRGDIDVRGHVDMSEGPRGAVGGRAYITSGTFDVTSDAQKIPFDTVSADQRDEFDTSDGAHYFECAYDGTYVVEVGIVSAGFDSSTGTIQLDINIDSGTAGSSPAADQGLNYEFDGNGNVARTFTQTIYGLLAGNRISVTIQDSSEDLALFSGEDETFMSVRQVGGGGNYTG